MNGVYDVKRTAFVIEVAENGFIMTTSVPEGRKELRTEVKAIYLTESDLFSAISAYLVIIDEETVDNE